MQTQKIRDSRLDLIRSIALLMIITVHTWSLGRVTAFPLIAVCYNVFSGCGVPLFVMVSGALMLSRPIPDLHKFYRHRFLRILVPFFIWSFIVYVLSALLGKYDDIHSVGDALLAYFPRLMQNRINEAYWFVQMILLLYILTPMLRWTIEHLSMHHLVVFCVLWLGTIAMCDSFPDWYWVREYTSHSLVYVGYYVLGYVLYHGAEICRNHIVWLILLIFAAVAMMLCSPIQLRSFRIILVGGIFTLFCLCPQFKNDLLCFVSDSSYTVYLMHMLTIAPIYMFLHYGSDATAWQCVLIPIATTIVVAAICLCICYLLRTVTGMKAWWLGIR